MKKIFYIDEDISDETVKKFKLFLKPVKKEEMLYIRIDSWGGDSLSGKLIEGFIYYMKKYKSCKFTMEGIIAVSVAFRIFIRGNERIITPRHLIGIHLPVPNKANIAPERIAVQRNKDIKFIAATLPLLTKDEILEYDDMPLPVEFMLKKGIVTNVVSSF